jgi:hypothetical protein
MQQQHPDPYADRKRLTFEQAEGVESLPAQLKLKELSPLLRSAIWAVIYEDMKIWAVIYEDMKDTQYEGDSVPFLGELHL